MGTTDSKTGPFFCKLLIGDDYDDFASIFQIPYHFVKSYGDVLPSFVKLKYGESGKCWRVAIEKFRDHYFFTDGWKEFAEDADIKSLEYISFEIVGLSDPKKDLNSDTWKEIIKDKEEKLRPSDDELKNGISETLKEVDFRTATFTDILKLLAKRFNTDLTSRKSTIKQIIQDELTELADADESEDSVEDDSKMQRIVGKESNMAYRKAKSFKSENPFVISLMQPSYVTKTYRLCISKKFAKKYLDGKQNDLKLCDLDGKIWSVSCFLAKSSGAKIRVGWKNLVKYHKLKVGDVCVFEVNKLDHLLWNVIIFRN